MTKRKKRARPVALVLLAGLGIAWPCWPSRKLRGPASCKASCSPGAARSPPNSASRSSRSLRDVQKQLSPAQRKELRRHAEHRQADMARYFAMSPKERERHLDGLIRRQEQMKKSQQAKGGQGGGLRGRRRAGHQGRPLAEGARRSPPTVPRLVVAGRAGAIAQFRKELNDRRARLGLPAGGGGRGGPLRRARPKRAGGAVRRPVLPGRSCPCRQPVPVLQQGGELEDGVVDVAQGCGPCRGG